MARSYLLQVFCHKLARSVKAPVTTPERHTTIPYIPRAFQVLALVIVTVLWSGPSFAQVPAACRWTSRPPTAEVWTTKILLACTSNGVTVYQTAILSEAEVGELVKSLRALAQHQAAPLVPWELWFSDTRDACDIQHLTPGGGPLPCNY